MAQKVVSDIYGNIIYDSEAQKRLAEAAYKAVQPAAAPAQVMAYPAAQAQVPAVAPAVQQVSAASNPSVVNPYATAYRMSKAAQEKALGTTLSAIEAQRPLVDERYSDMARQAYASYSKGAANLPYQTRNIATGAQDNLALQAQLAYQNTRQGIASEKAAALVGLEEQIAQAKATGATNLAQLEYEYSRAYADYLNLMQQQTYQAQLAERQMEHDISLTDRKVAHDMEMERLRMSNAYALDASRLAQDKTRAPTPEEYAYFRDAYEAGLLTKVQFDDISSAYFGSIGVPYQTIQDKMTNKMVGDKIVVAGVGQLTPNELLDRLNLPYTDIRETFGPDGKVTYSRKTIPSTENVFVENLGLITIEYFNQLKRANQIDLAKGSTGSAARYIFNPTPTNPLKP